MLLADVVACHRLTRLVTADSLTQPARERLIEAAYTAQGRGGEVRYHQTQDGALDNPDRWQRYADHDPHVPRIAELVSCKWCASLWLAFGVVVVRRFRWWPTVRDALALSTGAALLTRLEGD